MLRDKINAELESIANNLPQFTSYVKKEQFLDGTRKPLCDADDVVSKAVIKYAEKLYAGRMLLAETENHAQARFTLWLQGDLRDLRKKRDRTFSNDAVPELVAKAEYSEEGVKMLVSEMRGRLKPKTVQHLIRCFDGEPLQNQTDKDSVYHMRAEFRSALKKID